MKQILSEKIAIILSADALILKHPSTIFTDDKIEVNVFKDEEEAKKYLSIVDIKIIPVFPIKDKEIVADRIYNYEGKIVLCTETFLRTDYKEKEVSNLIIIDSEIIKK